MARLLVENADAALSFSELHLRSGVDLPHLQEAARHLVVLKKAKVVPKLRSNHIFTDFLLRFYLKVIKSVIKSMIKSVILYEIDHTFATFPSVYWLSFCTLDRLEVSL